MSPEEAAVKFLELVGQIRSSQEAWRRLAFREGDFVLRKAYDEDGGDSFT